jgi:hypothetical protein
MGYKPQKIIKIKFNVHITYFSQWPCTSQTKTYTAGVTKNWDPLNRMTPCDVANNRAIYLKIIPSTKWKIRIDVINRHLPKTIVNSCE